MTNKFYKNPYFILTVTYLLAHFFMLILSGCWWDDWTFMTHNVSYIAEVASQSGRPEWNILVPFCWSLTNNGRIFIYFLYLLDALFIYEALKNSDLFNERDSLLISLLFVIIPVNDARILISNFAYGVGLFFFCLGLFLFTKWNKNKNLFFRIILLIVFYVSFILNSLMAYYYVLFIYLFALEMKDKDINIRNIFISARDCIFRYIDFFLLPFIYLTINKTLFPTHGELFGSYNSFDINSILQALIYIPLSMANSIITIVLNWIKGINILSVIIIVVGIIILYKYKNNIGQSHSVRYNFFVILFSLFVMFMALLPYVLVRENVIELNGVQGRDAILLPLSVALFFFGLLNFVPDKFRKYLY